MNFVIAPWWMVVSKRIVPLHSKRSVSYIWCIQPPLSRQAYSIYCPSPPHPSHRLGTYMERSVYSLLTRTMKKTDERIWTKLHWWVVRPSPFTAVSLPWHFLHHSMSLMNTLISVPKSSRTCVWQLGRLTLTEGMPYKNWRTALLMVSPSSSGW